MKKSNGKFYMAGTEGTGQYVVLASTRRGRIGVRVLKGSIDSIDAVGKARVRVEPTTFASLTGGVKKMRERLAGWKQPGQDDQNRFSTVEYSEGVRESVKTGFDALGVGSLKTTFNPDAPEWAKELAAN